MGLAFAFFNFIQSGLLLLHIIFNPKSIVEGGILFTL